MSNIGERVGFDIKQMTTYKIILLHYLTSVRKESSGFDGSLY